MAACKCGRPLVTRSETHAYRCYTTGEIVRRELEVCPDCDGEAADPAKVRPPPGNPREH